MKKLKLSEDEQHALNRHVAAWLRKETLLPPNKFPVVSIELVKAPTLEEHLARLRVKGLGIKGRIKYTPVSTKLTDAHWKELLAASLPLRSHKLVEILKKNRNSVWSDTLPLDVEKYASTFNLNLGIQGLRKKYKLIRGERDYSGHDKGNILYLALVVPEPR